MPGEILEQNLAVVVVGDIVDDVLEAFALFPHPPGVIQAFQCECIADCAAGTDLLQTSDKTLQSAKVFVAMIPILIVYPFIQKYFTVGMTLGAVKG